jgi:hypothetical protein
MIGIAVSAFVGAISDFSSSLLPVAASVLSVEARHSSFLRNALNLNPFPDALDTALQYSKDIDSVCISRETKTAGANTKFKAKLHL